MVAVVLAGLVGLLVGGLLLRLAGRVVQHTQASWDDRLLKEVRALLMRILRFAGDTVAEHLTAREPDPALVRVGQTRITVLRRLIVPITYFLEKPFQNWTKVSPDLLGTVVIHADYTIPIDKVREEVKRLCEANACWDGKAAGLVVLDATERTIVLRALVSAADASKQWDLRCSVREGLIRFLQELDGGRHLPKSRVMVDARSR